MCGSVSGESCAINVLARECYIKVALNKYRTSLILSTKSILERTVCALYVSLRVD